MLGRYCAADQSSYICPGTHGGSSLGSSRAQRSVSYVPRNPVTPYGGASTVPRKRLPRSGSPTRPSCRCRLPCAVDGWQAPLNQAVCVHFFRLPLSEGSGEPSRFGCLRRQRLAVALARTEKRTVLRYERLFRGCHLTVDRANAAHHARTRQPSDDREGVGATAADPGCVPELLADEEDALMQLAAIHAQGLAPRARAGRAGRSPGPGLQLGGDRASAGTPAPGGPAPGQAGAAAARLGADRARLRRGRNAGAPVLAPLVERRRLEA